MPPEQAEGKLDLIDHRSDIYSLGAILYEILTLERPIEGQTVHRVLLNVSDGKIVPPEERTPDRQIPKELSAVTLKAMARNRRKRYQSVPDLAQDIKLFLEGRAVSAKEDTFVEALTKLVKRNWAASIAAGVALLAVLAIGAAFTIDNAKKRRIAEEARDAAIEAQKKQRETATAASRELAEQASRAVAQGRLEEARVRAEAAAKVSLDSPWGPYALGTVARHGGRLEEAERHFREALTRASDHERSRDALAEVLAAQGELSKAASLLGRSGKEKSWTVLKEAGDVLYREERYRDAREAYTQARQRLDVVEGAPVGQKDYTVLLQKGDAFFASRSYAPARASYERALARMAESSGVTGEEQGRAKAKLDHATKALAEARDEVEFLIGSANAWVLCEGFPQELRALSAEDQCERLRKKFAEVHGLEDPMHPNVIREQIAEGALVSIEIQHRAYYPHPVKYLHPLCGSRIRALGVSGHPVRDLGPLKGLALESLDLFRTEARDLAPLTGMPLKSLNLGDTQVYDLKPLRGMRLESLELIRTRVTNLEPLEGMPLRYLGLQQTAVSDLTPLEGIPLTSLVVPPQVKDLSPLRGMPLESLDLGSVREVWDLRPLKGMPLTSLQIGATAVRDLRTLKGMPLTRLGCQLPKVEDLSPLRGMRLVELDCGRTRVKDLSPLAGMPLRSLCLSITKVKDLSLLRGMRLGSLSVNTTDIADLAPLRGMPLRTLLIHDTKVTDLTPLEGMSLETFLFTPQRISKGLEIIRAMRTLKKIGVAVRQEMTPRQFWKKYDAGEFR